MVEKNAPQRLIFVPGTNLGRSGQEPEKSDQLPECLEHLDALMCQVTCEDFKENDRRSFHDLNGSIHMAALALASNLATEARELDKSILVESTNMRAAA